MLVTPPEISEGEREVAILVDAATGVAGKIEPGRQVDVIASYARRRRRPRERRQGRARPLDRDRPGREGDRRRHAAREARQQRRRTPSRTPATVVPVTFALSKKQELRVAHAQVFAADVRLALLRPGDRPERTLDETIFRGRGPQDRRRRGHRMSARLLIAVADDETARRAAAQAREAELEVADIVIDPDELHRGLRRLDVDVVLLHDALGGTPVLDLARELASAFPEVGLILLAADDSPGLLRAAMQAGFRDVVALPLALESFEASVRSASQWSRTMRDRVTGEESAGASLGGQLVVVAGAKGGVGTTTVALHLGMAAARMAPGRPVCLVDFDLQKGDFRALLDTPHRRSVVDLVVVSNEISVRHLQETLYTHKDGFRLLLAPEQGEKAEDVDSAVARNVLSAVKARHALTVVDIGAVATEATAIAAEMASQVLVVTTPGRARAARRAADARPLEAARRARGRGRQGPAQPRVAAARDPARPGAQGRRRDDGPHDDPGRLQRARGRGQHRLAEPAGGQQAARRVRGAGQRARDRPAARGDRPPRRRAARPARPPRRRARPVARRSSWACSRSSRSSSSCSGRSRSPATRTSPPATPPARARASSRPTRPRPGPTRNGARPEGATGPRSPRTTRSRARTSRAPGASTPRSSCAATSRSPCACSVPLLIPGFRSPLTVGSTADTVLEDGDLSDRQDTTPHKNDYGEDGNWN